jgi:hypothetical protein
MVNNLKKTRNIMINQFVFAGGLQNFPEIAVYHINNSTLGQ